MHQKAQRRKFKAVNVCILHTTVGDFVMFKLDWSPFHGSMQTLPRHTFEKYLENKTGDRLWAT